MKILAIQDYLRVGGTETQFLNLTARWAGEGHEVQRLLFRRGGALYPLALAEGPPPRVLQPFSTPWNWWAPRLRSTVLSFQPDRVICFGRNAHWSFSRQFKETELSGLVATLRTGRSLPAGYRRILGAAESTVTNSRYAAGLAVQNGASSGRVQVIENGCRLADAVVPDRSAARKALGLEDHDCCVLCLGSFVPGKAQERLLSVWKEISPGSRRRLRLWFVGDGPRRADVENAAMDLPDGDRIQFWGSRSDPEQFLAAADGMVSVSREESSPNALVEGLWVGLPIAATRCAGVEELVSEESGGLLVEDSLEGERRIASWLESHPQEAERRLAACQSYREVARKRFDPTLRADDYLQLFDRLNRFSAV